MAKRGRKTNKKEAPKANDPKGYLDSNKNNFTDYKVIKGNKITMEGVSGQVYAIPVDSKGNAGQGRLLKAGENHEFEGASHVIEVPEVAMAQLGLNTGVNKLKQMGITTAFPDGDSYGGGAVATTESFDINAPLPFDKTNGIDPSSPLYNNFLNGAPTQPQGTFQPTTDLGTQDNSIAPIKTNGIKFGATPAELLQQSATSATDELEQKYAQTEEEDGTLDPTQKIQFDNPYGGVDIPTAAQTLGASLSYDGDQGGANTARGVASGLKLLTGLGRNVASGYGQNKRNQYVTEEENRKQQKANQGQIENRQQGGNITDRDLLSINDSTGIDFNAESANSLFTQVPNEVQGEQSPSMILVSIKM